MDSALPLGDGGALDTLQLQIAALRTHLQNPSLVPFPSIAAPAAASPVADGLPMRRQSSGGGAAVTEVGAPLALQTARSRGNASGFPALDERLTPIQERQAHGSDSDSVGGEAAQAEDGSETEAYLTPTGDAHAAGGGASPIPVGSPGGAHHRVGTWQRRLMRSHTSGAGGATDALATSAPLPVPLLPGSPSAAEHVARVSAGCSGAAGAVGGSSPVSLTSSSSRLAALRRVPNRTASLGAAEIGSRVSAVAKAAIANAVAATEAMTGLRRTGGSVPGSGGGGGHRSGSHAKAGSTSQPGTSVLPPVGSGGMGAAAAPHAGSRSRLTSTVLGASVTRDVQPEDLAPSPRALRPPADASAHSGPLSFGGAAFAASLAAAVVAAGGGGGGAGVNSNNSTSGGGDLANCAGGGARRRGVRRSVSLAAILSGSGGGGSGDELRGGGGGGRKALGGLLGEAAEAAQVPYSVRAREAQKAGGGGTTSGGATAASSRRVSQVSLSGVPCHLARASMPVTNPVTAAVMHSAQALHQPMPRPSDNGAYAAIAGSAAAASGGAAADEGSAPGAGGGKSTARRRGVRRAFSLANVVAGVTGGAAGGGGGSNGGGSGTYGGRKALGGMLGEAAANAALPYSQRMRDVSQRQQGGAGGGDPFRRPSHLALSGDLGIVVTSADNNSDAKLSRLALPPPASVAAASVIGPLGSLCTSRDDCLSAALAAGLQSQLHRANSSSHAGSGGGGGVSDRLPTSAAIFVGGGSSGAKDSDGAAGGSPTPYGSVGMMARGSSQGTARGDESDTYFDLGLMAKLRFHTEDGRAPPEPPLGAAAAAAAVATSPNAGVPGPPSRFGSDGGSAAAQDARLRSYPSAPLQLHNMSRLARQGSSASAQLPPVPVLSLRSDRVAGGDSTPTSPTAPSPGGRTSQALPAAAAPVGKRPALWKRLSWTGVWQRSSSQGVGVFGRSGAESQDGSMGRSSPPTGASPRVSAAAVPFGTAPFAQNNNANLNLNFSSPNDPKVQAAVHINDKLLDAARWSVARREKQQLHQPHQPHRQGLRSGSMPRRFGEEPEEFLSLPPSAGHEGVDGVTSNVDSDASVRRGPAWAVRRASQARQDQLVKEVSSWLREALQRRTEAAGGHADALRRSATGGLDGWKGRAATVDAPGPDGAGPYMGRVHRSQTESCLTPVPAVGLSPDREFSRVSAALTHVSSLLSPQQGGCHSGAAAQGAGAAPAAAAVAFPADSAYNDVRGVQPAFDD
ncbi:hypothetical protein GPECTOR_18g108 [Gonium pectorale]|uniref:Uncharacterized protein n=1 Tax=Gonium pectorale TaxID=33097 RepID=A0A150GKS4_GONPE|nr:hypothetical protein GPECTOR_18g108 [Gonium pectorale]|eukprot:KXZ49950.1 hypothetical protein GPECTOR_18g108 [Gonium pectorale]